MKKRRLHTPQQPHKPSALRARTTTSKARTPPVLQPVAAALLLGVAVVGFVIFQNSRPSFPSTSRAKSSHTPSTREKVSFVVPAPVFKVEVIAQYVHDLNAFTQGLACLAGRLYESTGLHGSSSVRRVDITTGDVLDIHLLAQEDFGEGLAASDGVNPQLVQVLWKVGKGYVYDRDTLRQIYSFDFDGDGWGLAARKGTNEFYLTDGTSRVKVFRLDNRQFVLVRTFTVRDGRNEVGLLNELEFIGDELWANVWMSDFVARINPETGIVTAWLDLRGILQKENIPVGHKVDVLNGIAYDETTRSIFITGKQWPKLFSIKTTKEKIADDITAVTNAFFLNREEVDYVLKNVAA